MVELNHEIKIAAPRERVLAALTTAAGLRAWHTTQVEGSGAVGSVWHLGFTGRPEFQWRVSASDQSHVAWSCVQGPGDSVGTTVTFDLSSLADGRSLLRLTHAGWPGTHGNFRNCNTIWGVLLHHLQQFAETKAPAPAFT